MCVKYCHPTVGGRRCRCPVHRPFSLSGGVDSHGCGARRLRVARFDKLHAYRRAVDTHLVSAISGSMFFSDQSAHRLARLSAALSRSAFSYCCSRNEPLRSHSSRAATRPESTITSRYGAIVENKFANDNSETTGASEKRCPQAPKLVVWPKQMVPICLDKSAHKILFSWGDLSCQMGTICHDRTTSVECVYNSTVLWSPAALSGSDIEEPDDLIADLAANFFSEPSPPEPVAPIEYGSMGYPGQERVLRNPEILTACSGMR